MARLPKPGSDQGKWGEILNDYLSQSHTDTGTLKDNTVGTNQLQTNSITTPQLQDNAITTPKLADNSISTTKLQDNSIPLAKLQNIGQPNGIATLDTNGTLKESQVPDRLSETAITNEITEQVTPLVAQVGTDAQAALDGMVVSGRVVDDNLVLTRGDGTVVDAGDVRGPSGTLSGVSDGNLADPQDGDAPVFSSTTGEWESVSLPSTYAPLGVGLDTFSSGTAVIGQAPLADGVGGIVWGSVEGGSGEPSVYNVKSYGTIGDGTTDDTAAIQALLNVANTAGRVTIQFPAGTYLVGPLVLYANTSLLFDKAAVLLRKRSDPYIYTVAFVNGVKGATAGGYSGRGNILFDGMTYDGNRLEGDPVGDYRDKFSTFGHAENITFRNCTFIDASAGDHVFEIGGCRNFLVDNCEFRGIHGTAADRIEIVQVEAIGDSGAFPEFGPYDATPTRNLTIRNSTFTVNPLNAASRANCAIGDHGSYHCYDILIENCTFNASHYRAIGLPYVTGLTVRNCTFNDLPGIGVLANGGSKRITVEGCTINAVGNSIHFQGASTAPDSIADVTIRDNTLGATFLNYMSRAKIANNRTSGTSFLSLDRVYDSTVSENTVSGCSVVSINSRNSDRIAIVGNRFATNNPVTLDSYASTGWIFDGNTFNATGVVISYGSKTNHRFTNNEFVGCLMSVMVTSGLIITGNKFRGTDSSIEHVLRIYGASGGAIIDGNEFTNVYKCVYLTNYSEVRSNNVLFTNNRIIGVTSDTVIKTASYTSGLILDTNLFDTCATPVLDLSYGAQVMVRNNVFRNVTATNLRFQYTATDCEVTDNAFINTVTDPLPAYYIRGENAVVGLCTSNNRFIGDPATAFVSFANTSTVYKGDGVWLTIPGGKRRFRLEVDSGAALSLREII